ncbi:MULTISPECIES: glycosyltransferase family 87 protein [Bradyrhizobium]|uniref:DUF2029 domain-containing protein n=2 Tax=Bradyrhizobium TaxID=374 RepID=A0ABY0PG36_9BRAD|nr:MULTISPECIES: glycosyltransferase family 87 protein [Bradyrhizobium]SDI30683.1 Protein of unknown function [Bradyrhizobium ottawaense]SED65489.1 Protein of unknown function [Bradyrhizobium lablabi]SHL61893.1 Protein of unknown function [Bradyrhizobium lablabi]
MTNFRQGLRSGEWLTAARIRGYCLIMIGLGCLAIAGWIALSHSLVDPNGKPIGTDFSSFYAAGSLALQGNAAEAYDMAAHHTRQQLLFGPDTPYYGWLYPPNFFLLAAPLARVPYPLALAVWQVCTFALYLGVIGAILRDARRDSSPLASLWLLAAAAFPAVFINLGHGQNGFLSAALLGGALVMLPRRPGLAGVLFGLLAYKPQFALVVPFALLASGQWRTIVTAAVTVIAVAGASLFLFGADAWTAFFASTETSRKLLLEEGGVGFEKLQSAFAAIRVWGGSVTLAYLVQAVVGAIAVCCTAWVWRSQCDANVKAALLIAATAVASPHILDYDLMLLAPAMAFLVATRAGAPFRDYEISLLAAVWIAPLVARAFAGATGVPLGFLAGATLFTLIAGGAIGKPAAGSLRVAQA